MLGRSAGREVDIWPWNRAYEVGEDEPAGIEGDALTLGDMKSRWLFEEPPIKSSDMRMQSCIDVALVNSYNGRGPSGPLTASILRADSLLVPIHGGVCAY